MTFARGLLRRLAGIAAPTAILAACIVAEPGADVPKPAPERPHILRPSVVPPAGAVLGTFPSKFVVPVELSDPTLSFQYAGFVDYDPSTNLGSTNVCDQDTTSGQVRIVEAEIPKPQDLDRCHVIEVIVALQIFCGLDANAAHAPPEPGGDSVSWIYSPTGDLAGCPVLDAGSDASRNDSGQVP